MKRALIYLAAALLLAVGCDVHEFPTGEEDLTLTIVLNCDDTMTLLEDLEFETRSKNQTKALAEDGWKLRTMVNVYEAQPGGTWSLTPWWSTEILDDDLTNLTREFTVTIPPKHYRALVWTDYVNTDGTRFYSADDFPEVYMLDSGIGGTDYKRAFTTMQDIPLQEITEQGAEIRKEYTLEMPLAKVKFTATDIEDFKNRMRERSIPSAYSPEGPRSFEDMDINSFTLKITYQGYVPDTWNVREQLTSDSHTGRSFSCTAQLRDDGIIDLGFDYIVVDGHTTVDLAIEVFDDRDVLLTRVPKLTVPIEKGKITNVIGKLMTHGISGAVVVDNNYDGEYNIYI